MLTDSEFTAQTGINPVVMNPEAEQLTWFSLEFVDSEGTTRSLWKCKAPTAKQVEKYLEADLMAHQLTEAEQKAENLARYIEVADKLAETETPLAMEAVHIKV